MIWRTEQGSAQASLGPALQGIRTDAYPVLVSGWRLIGSCGRDIARLSQM